MRTPSACGGALSHLYFVFLILFAQLAASSTPSASHGEESSNGGSTENGQLQVYRLHSAALSGDLKLLKQILDGASSDEKVDVNEQVVIDSRAVPNSNCLKCIRNGNARYNGSTPLHYAVEGQHVEAVKLLLDKGADVNQPRRDGWTALHYAANNGNTEIVQLLLDRNAEIDAMMKEVNATPLHFATYKGHMEIIKLLLQKCRQSSLSPREYVNMRKERNITALYDAAFNGFAENVQILLDNGADPYIQTEDGTNAFHASVINGQTEVVRLFIEKSNVDVSVERNDGGTPLHDAAFFGHPAIVALIVETGYKLKDEKCSTNDFRFNMEATTTEGITPLYGAIYNGHSDIVKYLLDHGAKYNYPHWNAIQIASQAGRTSLITNVINRLDTKPLEQWDKDDVCYFISKLEHESQLSRWTHLLFRRNTIENKESNHFHNIDRDALKKLGITGEKDQQIILNAIEDMKTTGINKMWNNTKKIWQQYTKSIF